MSEPDLEFTVDVNDPNLLPVTLSPVAFLMNATTNNGTTSSDDTTFEYVCQDNSPEHLDVCPTTCVGLDDCLGCECQVLFLTDTGGPWGEVMDVLFCLLPIIYLIIVTIKPNPTPTTTSLPMSAAIMFLVRLMYLGSNPILTSACVILGVHEAITPLSIMAGAITLFETMEATKCLPYMMREMKALTNGHKVAETMLLFGFATLVEGASGFGTPVALGAPMLVSTGNPPLESVVIMLVFNTFATVWGAVGTPLWFGFGSLDLTEDQFLEISMKAAICMLVSSFILIPFILTILIPFAVVKRNIIFLFLSIGCVMGPLVGLATINYEFPSLIGGLVGCGLNAILIKFKVGMAEQNDDDFAESAKPAAESTNEAGGEEDDDEDNNDPNRGYHRAISDLTEIPVKSVTFQGTTTLASTTAPTKEAESHATTDKSDNDETAGDGANASKDDKEVEAGDDDGSIKNLKSSMTGNWNIEVQKDNDEAPNMEEENENGSRTVVYVAPSTSVNSNGDIEAPAKESNENGEQQQQQQSDEGETMEPTQLFPEETETTQKPTASMKQSSTSREDALLGPRKSYAEGYLVEVILRTFPIWGVVLTLILTRVETFGIKPVLNQQSPYWEVQFGTYGDFRLSVAAVLQLRHILTYPNLNWKYELFYIPFLVPFVVISCLTMLIFRKDLTCSPRDIASTVSSRLANPAIAVCGALILVQLMIKNGTESPAFLLGVVLAGWFKQGFVVIAPLLGALGSFFSGSTTVSNLTFGEIQMIAAEEIGISTTSMLALQAYGASAGNGICLNNIIAALAVVGLNVSEGQILMRTCKYVFASTTISTIVMLALFIRF
ncbi:Putative L-lactate permease [Seminavis robusta]|uniref:L-lactate permease n=1 Tax=Seminavis robusta TaxID=568900 RepID=A0A9N8EHR8_9STRA|nr:Putative L-lactate permease [Seminavis robusta]|eukprot:Sro1120_g243350.1 Putative L-lactate permease (835) ;mRNA; r:26589-29201